MQVSEASGTLEEEEMPLMKMREDHTNVCQMSAVGASEDLSQDYQELLKEEDWVSKKTFEVESSMGGLEKLSDSQFEVLHMATNVGSVEGLGVKTKYHIEVLRKAIEVAPADISVKEGHTVVETRIPKASSIVEKEEPQENKMLEVQSDVHHMSAVNATEYLSLDKELMKEEVWVSEEMRSSIGGLEKLPDSQSEVVHMATAVGSGAGVLVETNHGEMLHKAIEVVPKEAMLVGERDVDGQNRQERFEVVFEKEELFKDLNIAKNQIELQQMAPLGTEKVFSREKNEVPEKKGMAIGSEVLVEQGGPEELLVWPPTVIVENTRVGKSNDGRWTGIGNIEMTCFLRDIQHTAGKPKSCWGRDGHKGQVLVQYPPTRLGLEEAERLHNHFAAHGRSRKKWRSIRPFWHGLPGEEDLEEGPDFLRIDDETQVRKRVFYGYLALAEDIGKVYPPYNGKRKWRVNLLSRHQIDAQKDPTKTIHAS